MGEIGGLIGDLREARAVTDTARSLLAELRGTAFWRLPDLDLLALAQELEGLRRLSYTAQVHTARAVLARDLSSGGETEPALPLLADVLVAGEIGAEQTRTIVTTMRKLPAKVDAMSATGARVARPA